MSMDNLRDAIANLIHIQVNESDMKNYEVIESVREDGYTRNLIKYDSSNDIIKAYLLIPDSLNNNPAILINHQHNSERYLGKSEVCGLAGNPLQAFGPALARKGFVVLAPDSLCFEDRRKNTTGITPLPDDGDFLQHYNEMCYRILIGENLMKKVIEDAMQGISLLMNLEYVDKNRIGSLGHSYGGNTVLFHTALDNRIRFACASGSACTYKNRMSNGVGIEMASVIPAFYNKYDIDDVVRCIAPRHLLIISADKDKYSMDADYVAQNASELYAAYNNELALCHKRYSGGHALTSERFEVIINWLSETSELLRN